MRRALAILAVSAMLSAACATTTINKVLADPSRYRNRDVTLSGTVVDSYSLAGRGAYQVADGTGRLWVVSSHGVPRTGAAVRVKGQVREGVNLGALGGRINLPPGVAAGLVILESSHKAR